MTDKTTEALKRVEVWVESLTGLHPEVSQEQGEILAAIRDALAEQSLGEYHGKLMREVCNKVITETLAAPEQEPVAWRIGNEICAREDWACVIPHGSFVGKGRAIPDSWVPLLYAAPVSAKREWVELEPWQLCEIEERIGLPIDSHDFETIGNAYIAAFKEKNK